MLRCTRAIFWNVEGEIDEDVEKARQRIAVLGGVEAHAKFADDPVEGLRRYGASVSLLVLGAHKHGPLGLLLERTTSQRLADDTPSPLLVLSPVASRSGLARE